MDSGPRLRVKERPVDIGKLADERERGEIPQAKGLSREVGRKLCVQLAEVSMSL